MPRSSRKSTLLVFNVGSSSVKFGVWQGSHQLARGAINGIGAHVAVAGTWRTQAPISARTPEAAVRWIISQLKQRRLRPEVVAHRIVHGGEHFRRPAKLSVRAMQQLKALTPLAPLHMPHNLLGVRLAHRAWPKAQQWGVFDTAPYVDLDPAVSTYALPLALSQRWHIRKYGFHGISHADALSQAMRKLKRTAQTANAVTIHLGAGDSMTAWRKGKPLDTSMGFTPLEGLTMATRSGDLDPSIPLFLQQHAGLSVQQVSTMLEQRSGLFGLTGLRDIRDVLSAAGHPVTGWPRRSWNSTQRRHARLAIAMFLYDIQRYLASYLGLLPDDAAIVFTGAVGQNPWIRKAVLQGVPIARGRRVVVIQTDEERAIATAVQRVVH